RVVPCPLRAARCTVPDSVRGATPRRTWRPRSHAAQDSSRIPFVSSPTLNGWQRSPVPVFDAQCAARRRATLGRSPLGCRAGEEPNGLADQDTTEGVRVADAAHEGPPAADSGGLAEREVAILAFERRWWQHAGAKEQAIREEFGLSAARYYQLLGA